MRSRSLIQTTPRTLSPPLIHADIPLVWRQLVPLEWSFAVRFAGRVRGVLLHVRYQLFLHSVILIEWVSTVMIPSGHMTSIVLSERDPPLLLSWRFLHFFPLKGCLEVVPGPMWGQRSGMSMCTDCKALWDTFVICENGLYNINWIELNWWKLKNKLRFHISVSRWHCGLFFWFACLWCKESSVDHVSYRHNFKERQLMVTREQSRF